MKDEYNLVNIDFEHLRRSVSYREQMCRQVYLNHGLRESISAFVIKNSGQESDVKDIFQEAIVRFFNKVMEPDFILTQSVGSYIFGIARNTFYSQFKTKINFIDLERTIQLEAEPIKEGIDIVELVSQLLDFTTETCRQVLIYWSKNYKMSKIAELMSYKSEMMARKKKHECIKKLSTFLKENPSITNKIINDE